MTAESPISNILSLCFLITLSAGVQSQGTTQRPAILSDATVIEEVIVTAQKRDQNLQHVGIAITAIDGEAVEQLRLKDPHDLVSHTPNLQMPTVFAASNPVVFLRGVGVNDNSAIASSAVSFYVDQVYIGAPTGQLFQFHDLERVEVLRGPQGTLYGRNTTGGAINFISRKPTRELQSNLRLGYGRYEERTVEGAVSGPFSEKLAARLAFVSNKRDGYVDNRYLGTDDSDTDNWAARGFLQYQPSESVELLAKVHAGRNDSKSKRNKSEGLLDPAAVTAGNRIPCETPANIGTCSDVLGYIDNNDSTEGNWNRRGDEDVDSEGTSVTLTWDLPRFSLTSITAYDETDRFIEHDADGSPNQLAEIDWEDDSAQWTQELRMLSAPAQTLEWMVGLYYYDRTVRIDQVNDARRELRPVLGFNPDAGVFTLQTRVDADISAYAAFGQLHFGVTDKTRILAGLRYTSEEHSIDRFDRIEEPDFLIPLVNLADSNDFDGVSGKVAVEHTIRNNSLLYASISKGFKSGGFNGSVAVDPDAIPPFDEETVLSYEAGFKWLAANGRLRVNTAGFFYDYTDLQVFSRINTGGVPRSVLTNAADAEIFGFELELLAKPIDSLDIELALGLLESELKDFQTFGGNDFSGNKLVNAPQRSLSGMIRKEWSLWGGSVAVQADLHYQDKVFFSTSNDPLLAEDAYSVWNARLAWRSSDKRWEFALWGENLGDEEYKVAAVGLSDFGFNLITYGEPRTYGLELRWQY